MTREEFCTLWCAARNTFFGKTIKDSRELSALLGVEYPRVQYYEVMPYDDRMIAQLQALLGPHGKTMLKVIEARKVKA